MCYVACRALGINQAGFKVLIKAHDTAYAMNNESPATDSQPISMWDITKGSFAGVFGSAFILSLGAVRMVCGFNSRGLNSIQQANVWHTALNSKIEQDETASSVEPITTFFKGGLLGIVVGSAWSLLGVVRAVFGFNSHATVALGNSFDWLGSHVFGNGVVSMQPGTNVLKGGLLAIFGSVLSSVLYLLFLTATLCISSFLSVSLLTLGISPFAGDAIHWANQWHNVFNNEAEPPVESMTTLVCGGLFGFVLGSIWIVLGLARAVIGLNHRTGTALSNSFAWFGSQIFGDGQYEAQKGMTVVKGGLIAVLGSIAASAIAITLLTVGLSSRGIKGALAGMTTGYNYLTSSLFETAYDDIKWQGGVLTFVFTSLSLAIAGTLGLIANDQSIVMFGLVRNFFSDTQGIENQLPSLALWRHDNRTWQNAEKLLKQVNLASAALSTFVIAAIGAYAMTVALALTVRLTLYRIIYQGSGLAYLNARDKRYDDINNYRDYLITHEVSDTLTIDTLNTYRQEKKGFFTALWQDITRAYRLGTQTIGEKVVQRVINYLEHDKTLINTEDFYIRCGTLTNHELCWDNDSVLIYTGPDEELKHYFEEIKITLEQLGLNDVSYTKQTEMTQALKSIGLFATSSRKREDDLNLSASMIHSN